MPLKNYLWYTMKILIVEDNSKMRDLIHKTIVQGLKDVDTVHACRNGQEAIDQYEIFKPDWVLMDIKMETVNGLTASQKIREEHPDAKIIILTYYDDPLYRESAKNFGVRAYVLKENLSDLPALIKNIL